MEKSKQQRDYYLGLSFVIIGAIAFSAKAVMIKLAYAAAAETGTPIDAISLMTLRMLIALPFFIAVAIWDQTKTQSVRLINKDYFAIFCLGFLGYYFASLLDFEGLKYISAGLERLILFLYPSFVVIFSAIILRRRIKRVEIGALLLSYIGIAFVVADEINAGNEKLILGSLLILFSAVAFAFFLIGSGEMIKRIGSTRFTAYAMSVSCLITLSHYAVVHGLNLPKYSNQVYGLGFLLAIISTVIPAFLINAGIHRVGASVASIVSSIGPISTLILAYYLLNEEISAIQIMGTILVIFGVFLIGKNKTK